MPTTPAQRELSVPALAEHLERAGLISTRQVTDVVRNEKALRERIMRRRLHEGAVRQMVRYVVSPAEVLTAASFAMPDGQPLTEDRVMQEVAKLAGLRWVKIDPLKLTEKLITETMSRPFARRYICIPLEKRPEGRIVFAVDNPWDLELQQSLESLVPAGIELVVSAKSDILRVITDVYGFKSAVTAAERTMSPGSDLGNLEQLVKLTSVEEIEGNDKHVVKATEYLLHYAFDQRASDIHLEPKRDEALIRLRIDGVLHTVYRMPRVVHGAVVSRLKTLCRMDIAERRRPQDGRFKTQLDGRETEMRVSSLPVAFGEKLVIRIFDPQMMLQEIDSLGFFEDELSRFRDFLARETGLILITGPTGSGKTTTLYSAMRVLASPEVNITTVEDPIEMVYEAFNQTLVQPKIGVNFATTLRNVLRQDPDIIMVGEIRDAEVAEMAVQAALTGHLVLSTLHTNDAPTAITRLQDLGVPDFLIGSTLAGIVAQRLVRRICDGCRTPTELNEEQAAMLGIELPPGAGHKLPAWYGAGCPQCRGTGFRGRIGIFEVMAVDAGIRRLIAARSDAETIRREAVANGMSTLRESAIRKLALGVTSFEEVIRVLGETA